MKFDELNKHIPKGTKGKTHSVKLDLGEGPGWAVRVSLPGKYGPNDYVVQVQSEGVWDEFHNFTHGDFFKDIQGKCADAPGIMRTQWLPHVLRVIQGGTTPAAVSMTQHELPGVDLAALTLASQALAVCEYRRYPQGDAKGGGRYLPINYTSAMMYGHWSAEKAWKMMRVGLPALKMLKGFSPFTHTDNVDNYVVAMEFNNRAVT